MKGRLVYIILSYGTQALSIIINLIFMQRLPASTLGDIAVAKIWMQGFDYTHLGTRFALDRYVPVTSDSKQRSVYLCIALSVVLSGSSILLAIAIMSEYPNKILVAFCLVGLILAIYNIFKAYFRATGDLLQVNRLVFFLYFIPLAISLAAVIYDFLLFLWIYPAVFLLSLLFFVFKSTKSIVTLNTLRVGFFPLASQIFSASKVLFINSLLVYAFLVVDRIFVDWLLGREALGSYSVIMFVFASLFTVPSILTELIFPKVVRQVINNNKIFFFKEMLIVCSLTLLAVIIANIAMFFLVIKYTEYGHLLPLMQVASLGVIPYAFTAIIYHVLNALDKRYLIVVVNLTALLIYFFALFFAYGFSTLNFFVYIKVASSVVLLFVYCAALYSVRKLNKPLDCRA